MQIGGHKSGQMTFILVNQKYGASFSAHYFIGLFDNNVEQVLKIHFGGNELADLEKLVVTADLASEQPLVFAANRLPSPGGVGF
jgi:hypothetical protein